MPASPGRGGKATRGRLTRRPVWWVALTVLAVLVYLGLTLAIILPSPLVNWDADLARLDLRHTWPEWRSFVFYYVMLGQRGPATLAFLPFFAWAAYRERSSRPVVMLVVSLILLNLSVGIVKLAIGRLGPRDTGNVHAVFVSGNIYPSGHVSNAVVLYGLIAMLVVSHRVLIATAAALVSITVGLGTVYLNTHWLSDVVGGWLAGALVLLVLPLVMPFCQRRVDSVVGRIRRRRERDRIENLPAGYPLPESRPARVLSAPEFGSGAHQAETITPVASNAWSRSPDAWTRN